MVSDVAVGAGKGGFQRVVLVHVPSEDTGQALNQVPSPRVAATWESEEHRGRQRSTRLGSRLHEPDAEVGAFGVGRWPRLASFAEPSETSTACGMLVFKYFTMLRYTRF